MKNSIKESRQSLTEISRVLEQLYYDSGLSKENKAVVRDVESLLDDARFKLFMLDE
mgnify:CR=1 FL=1